MVTVSRPPDHSLQGCQGRCLRALQRPRRLAGVRRVEPPRVRLAADVRAVVLQVLRDRAAQLRARTAPRRPPARAFTGTQACRTCAWAASGHTQPYTPGIGTWQRHSVSRHPCPARVLAPAGATLRPRRLPHAAHHLPPAGLQQLGAKRPGCSPPGGEAARRSCTAPRSRRAACRGCTARPARAPAGTRLRPPSGSRRPRRRRRRTRRRPRRPSTASARPGRLRARARRACQVLRPQLDCRLMAARSARGQRPAGAATVSRRGATGRARGLRAGWAGAGRARCA